LPWENDESAHLIVLQKKLNAYLRFVESGEVFEKVPDARGRNIVINLVGKFRLSESADIFLRKVSDTVENAGLRLRFGVLNQN
jgi:hypothetical protein